MHLYLQDKIFTHPKNKSAKNSVWEAGTKSGPCAPLAERPKVGCCRSNLLQPPRSVGPVGRGQAARTASRPSPPVVRRPVAAVAAAAVAGRCGSCCGFTAVPAVTFLAPPRVTDTGVRPLRGSKKEQWDRNFRSFAASRQSGAPVVEPPGMLPNAA